MELCTTISLGLHLPWCTDLQQSNWGPHWGWAVTQWESFSFFRWHKLIKCKQSYAKLKKPSRFLIPRDVFFRTLTFQGFVDLCFSSDHDWHDLRMVWWWLFWQAKKRSDCNEPEPEGKPQGESAGRKNNVTTSEVTQVLWFRACWDFNAFYRAWWRRHLTCVVLTYRIEFLGEEAPAVSTSILKPKDVHYVTMRAFKTMSTCDSFHDIWTHLMFGSYLKMCLIWCWWNCLGKDWMKTRVFQNFGPQGTSMAWSHRRGGEMECERGA